LVCEGIDVGVWAILSFDGRRRLFRLFIQSLRRRCNVSVCAGVLVSPNDKRFHERVNLCALYVTG
jgi:hypothetical protein